MIYTVKKKCIGRLWRTLKAAAEEDFLKLFVINFYGSIDN